MLYNFGGGTFEDKGHTRFEIDVVAKEITDGIKKGFFVIILPGTSQWNSPERIDEILKLIPEDKRVFCVKNVPTPMQDSFIQPNIMCKSDVIKTVEGGVAHIATGLAKPTEIAVKNGVESGMWRVPSGNGRSESLPLLEVDLIKNIKAGMHR